MEIDLTECQLVLWSQNHPEVEVSIKWGDFVGCYRLKLSLRDRHICFMVPYPLVEDQMTVILDELLNRLEDIPPWPQQTKS